MKTFKEFIIEHSLLFQETSEPQKVFGPIYHRTNANINSLKDFDMSKASSSAVLGPAIYASLNNDKEWNPSHLKDGKTIKAYVKGDIIDLTKPTPQEHLDRLGKLIGRKVDVPPLTSLERRFGSVAAGLRAAGFAGAIHQGPGGYQNHIAVFHPENILDDESPKESKENTNSG